MCGPLEGAQRLLMPAEETEEARSTEGVQEIPIVVGEQLVGVRKGELVSTLLGKEISEEPEGLDP